ncbi:SDR family NAD(P)-dependent oxidoreductase [Antrihabitans stalactiti]|uniref:SDR family oxidoreductase n=1 Tax=Antrihabitans stalactiti TaxID=2584121 RepID=A0A848KBQ6_9NOCA|nr:SDR family oxidoreductase [Antrihabitans stalactiti]
MIDRRQTRKVYAGKVAIVTGGASGIGASLVRALRSEGATVISADLQPGGDDVALDVTHAAAVQALVDRVVDEHGRLDLMFNNAGISLIGETQDLSLAQWNSIIDVKIRGVVHGVAAAYPQFIRQGNGHIVNTASMGGLMAAGLLTSYVMTKHAVVGLSLALRSEAAAYGVGVTAICPAAVNTPILDKGEFGTVRGRDYFLKGQGIRKPVDPDLLAQRVLAAVAAGQALVVEPVQARMAWRLQRFLPAVTQKASIRFIAKQRKLAAEKGAR